MKYSLTVVVTLLAPALAYSQDKVAPRSQITTAQIHNADVIGSLGVPLGECVRIEAVITKGGRTKAQSNKYHLLVTHVAGQKLAEPVQRFFYVHQFATDRVKVANGAFGLHELRTGKKAGRLGGNQIEELEQGYVGSRVSLVVFDTGSFDGIPNNMPKNLASWQDSGYGLKTYLAVMDQMADE